MAKIKVPVRVAPLCSLCESSSASASTVRDATAKLRGEEKAVKRRGCANRVPLTIDFVTLFWTIHRGWGLVGGTLSVNKVSEGRERLEVLNRNTFLWIIDEDHVCTCGYVPPPFRCGFAGLYAKPSRPLEDV